MFAGTYVDAVWRRPLSDFVINGVKNSATISDEIQLSPNPILGIILIRNAPENLTSISILNVLGEKVMDITSPHSPDFTIDLSNLPSGIYDIVFSSPNSVEVKKIIKQ